MTIAENREKIISALARRSQEWGEKSDYDFALEAFYREVSHLPPAPKGREPYEGLISTSAKEAERSPEENWYEGRQVDWLDFSSRITQHFTVGEYLRYDAARTPYDDEIKKNAIAILMELEKIRKAWDGPIEITSGYRPPAVNSACGGALYSQHLNGHAVDIAPIGGDIHKFQKWLDYRWEDALGYGAWKGFVHLDMREGRGFVPGGSNTYGARWDY